MPMTKPKDGQFRIAFVPANGLGDGMLQLTFARIFQNNGYAVTCFHPLLAHLSDIFEDIQLKPVPESSDILAAFKDFDLVMYDVGSKMEAMEMRFPDHWVPYTMARRRTMPTLPETRLEKLPPLVQQLWYSERNVYDRTRKDSVIRDIEWFCTNQLGLYLGEHTLHGERDFFTRHPLDPDSRRILIHAFSSHPDKNWDIQRYFDLAKKLQNNGWQPVFSAAPNEEAELITAMEQYGQAFDYVVLKDLLELCRFYRGARGLIGNDSGCGHLASFLGLPTVTILNGIRPRYRWRPIWSRNRLVWGWLPRKLVKDSWSEYLSVARVYRAFEKTIP